MQNCRVVLSNRGLCMFGTLAQIAGVSGSVLALMYWGIPESGKFQCDSLQGRDTHRAALTIKNGGVAQDPVNATYIDVDMAMALYSDDEIGCKLVSRIRTSEEGAQVYINPEHTVEIFIGPAAQTLKIVHLSEHGHYWRATAPQK